MFKSLSEAKVFVRKNCEVIDVFRLNAETHVVIRLVHDGRVIYVRGMATCSKDDVFDPILGASIAQGRAVVSLARQLYREARMSRDLDLLRDLFIKSLPPAYRVQSPKSLSGVTRQGVPSV
jgi:hypothetical protein